MSGYRPPAHVAFVCAMGSLALAIFLGSVIGHLLVAVTR